MARARASIPPNDEGVEEELEDDFNEEEDEEPDLDDILTIPYRIIHGGESPDAFLFGDNYTCSA